MTIRNYWKKLGLVAGFATMCPALVYALPSKGTADLAPHRAVYEMKLDETRPASGVSGVSGRMVFEFAGSNCDGYTMNMRLVTQVEGEGGSAIVTDLRSSTWEQGEGARYRFNSSNYRGAKLESTTQGDAERKNVNGDVKVHVKEPEQVDLNVTGPVLFPTQHSLAIIHAAKRGEKVLQARVFDGSSKGDEVYMTTAFIGKKAEPGSLRPKKDVKNGETLSRLESWPVSISYFKNNDDGSEIPVYQLAFRLYSNGISRELQIDYGDFAIKGDLSALELIPESKCE